MTKDEWKPREEEKTIYGTEFGTFMDKNCIIEFQGRKFESGGAYLGVSKEGKMGGVVYAHPKDRCVKNWHGTIRIPAKFTAHSVKFKWCGRILTGRLSKHGDNVRVREVKE